MGAEFDDGSGPALYVAGPFRVAGGMDVNGVARWDGQSWSGLGSGLDNAGDQINALAVFDDGSGPALYAAGRFTSIDGLAVNNIARWDGESWSAVGSGLTGGFSRALTLEVFDDGSGPALYAGGEFTEAGGLPARNLARWDGSSWSDVGGSVDTIGATVRALEVFDDGSGPVLVIGGLFNRVGGVSAWSLAEWDGVSWSELGAGLAQFSSEVYALLSHHDRVNQTLYVGGEIEQAGGTPVENIAQWDGQSWAAAGDGLRRVEQLVEFDGGVYARTVSSFPETAPVLRLAVQQWIADPPLNQSTVQGLATFNPGADDERLIVGSSMLSSDTTLFARGASAWDGERWSPLGDGLVLPVVDMEFFDEGEGPRLFVAGGAPSVDGVTPFLSRWDGQAWSAVGDAVSGAVTAMTVLDDGLGPALYAGGVVSQAGASPAYSIAKWDGVAWSDLGADFGGIPGMGVWALTPFDDDEDGAASLFVVGDFRELNGITHNSVAKWDGAAWSTLGDGLRLNNPAFGGPTFGRLSDAVTHNDGSGPALYVGGAFDTAGGQPAMGVARWDGQQWSSVGDSSFARTLTVHDDGDGPMLYRAGFGRLVFVWDGAVWTSIGETQPNGSAIITMAVFDDGSGPALFVGGEFESIDGVPANGIAKWDGESWAAVELTDQENPGIVRTFASSHAATGELRGLFVGGDFQRLIPTGDDFLARYVGCAAFCPGDTNGDGVVNFADLSAVLSTYGQTGEALPGDVDGDGTVTFSDLNAVLSAFGVECG
ncbi:MAG: hypothetical protein ACTS27_05325 [Phycisphaerales bacterium]